MPRETTGARSRVTWIRSSAFALAGFAAGRRPLIWEFVADSLAKVGDWSVERGESIRIVRTATPLVEFRRRVGAWESSLRLGEVYFRLLKLAGTPSRSAANLETVIGPESASFDLALSLTRTISSRDLWVVTARLENLTAENSDLAFFDSNYVQIDVEGAADQTPNRGSSAVPSRSTTGYRSSMQALRSANQVRLYLPYVDGHQVAESGPVTLRLRGENPQLRISASFLLPEGRVFATDPIDWSFETLQRRWRTRLRDSSCARRPSSGSTAASRQVPADWRWSVPAPRGLVALRSAARAPARGRCCGRFGSATGDRRPLRRGRCCRNCSRS
ncbi:MAG: hypothetical protein R2862_12330 [Thermoanaerobaculia bacterium]